MATLTRTNFDGALFLRRVLQVDGAAVTVSGAAFLAGAGRLEELLGIPAALQVPLGAALLVWAAVLIYGATRPVISRRLGWAAVIVNALWVADSVLLLVAGWLPLTQAGFWFVAAQALAVAVLAELQYIGLRRMR
ncbi:MAG: hypothetical protein DIU80_017485 [Chloroflexota bacterium]|mgnify:CR=1 FL=1|nr:MAG: hypothetical protein DIU80_12150 [Chloroflexota bacterium]